MSLITTLLALATSAYSAVAVPSERRTDTIAAESFAAGVLTTPALEGGGPWFLSAVRLSAPLGPKRGLDIEAGRIFGGSTKYAEIDRFAAAQFRFVRNVAPGAPTLRYWLAGLR